MKYIDIHAHVLPSIDDGPREIRQALELLSAACREGIETIIATPHCFNGVYHATRSEILSACHDLQKEIDLKGIPITLAPGAENRVTHELITHFDKGEVMTLNNSGQYLLLELPDMFLLEGIVAILRQLNEREVIPIIAHPERNRFILSKPNLLQQFLSEGALLQLTASSLMGSFGKNIKKLSERLIKMEVISFIASDIHPGRRYRVKDALHRVTQLTGKKTVSTVMPEWVDPTLSIRQHESKHYSHA